jgi:acyl carrier protein
VSSYTIEAMPFAPEHLPKRVRDVLSSVLNVDAPADTTDLIETGLLDSLALVSLILELENNFGLSVSYDELEIDQFRTIESISHFVATGLAGN